MTKKNEELPIPSENLIGLDGVYNDDCIESAFTELAEFESESMGDEALLDSEILSAIRVAGY